MSSSHRPTFAIVIPTICRPTLLDALASSLGQLGGVLDEVVVCIDYKARNEDVSFIFDFIDSSPRGEMVRVLFGKESGVAHTLNYAISQANSDFISWLSDDDLYMPNKLLSQYIYLRKRHSTQELINSNVIVFSDALVQGTEVTSLVSISGLYKDIDNQGSCINTLSLGGVSGCAALFNKKIWEACGCFPASADFTTTQDYVFWLSCSRKLEIEYYLPQPLITSRLHPGQESNVRSNESGIQKDRLFRAIYASYLSHVEQSDTLRLLDILIACLGIQDGRGGLTHVTSINVQGGDICDSKDIAKLHLDLNKIAVVFIGCTSLDELCNQVVSLVVRAIADAVWEDGNLNGASFPDFVSSQFDLFVDSLAIKSMPEVNALKYDYRYIILVPHSSIATLISLPHVLLEEVSSLVASPCLDTMQSFCLSDDLSALSVMYPVVIWRSVFLSSHSTVASI